MKATKQKGSFKAFAQAQPAFAGERLSLFLRYRGKMLVLAGEGTVVIKALRNDDSRYVDADGPGFHLC